MNPDYLCLADAMQLLSLFVVGPFLRLQSHMLRGEETTVVLLV